MEKTNKCNSATLALLVFLVARAAAQSFLYEGCSQDQYSAGSGYETSLNSLLATLLKQASDTTYFNTSVGSGGDAVYGLYTCRGDLNGDQCSNCVQNCQSQISQGCFRSRGARIQLDGCFLRYDSFDFFSQPDLTFIHQLCGSGVDSTAEFDAHRNDVLAHLMVSGFVNNGNGLRTASSGDGRTGFVHGLAQCEGDLSPSDCDGCIDAAVQKLKGACGNAVAGEVFLSKCYARYGQDGFYREPYGVFDFPLKFVIFTVRSEV
eukprot:TRINITY_DN3320_c0_g1_i3.p1 TRINITY_DN3320_c0_g1~~TRINITY_DN3320_c0_g1_i3.p1  ORF type:complete len:262 (-),score=-7.42 TRINITY_DN3320_c0_g1_i3:384-1169(-)